MNHSYTNIDQLTTCTTSVALGVFELLHDYSKKYSEILDNPASFFTPYTQASDNSRALVQKEVNLQSLRPRFPTLSTSLFEHVFSEVWDYLAEEGIGVETKALLWGNVLKQASGQQFWNRLPIVDQNGKTCSLEDFQRQMINLHGGVFEEMSSRVTMNSVFLAQEFLKEQHIKAKRVGTFYSQFSFEEEAIPGVLQEFLASIAQKVHPMEEAIKRSVNDKLLKEVSLESEAVLGKRKASP